MQYLDQLNRDFESIIRIAGTVNRPLVPHVREPAIRLGNNDSIAMMADEPHPVGGCMGGTNLITKEKYPGNNRPENDYEAIPRVESVGRLPMKQSVFRLWLEFEQAKVTHQCHADTTCVVINRLIRNAPHKGEERLLQPLQPQSKHILLTR